MKKYIAVILIIGISLASVLFYNTKQVNEKAYKSFSDSGYVLQSKEENQNEVERYYFGSEQKYKQNYNEKITFEDTNGEKVTSDLNNYIHYSNGSISAFKNGVLVDLTMIDTDPIFYYNVAANSTLTKYGDSYKIKNLDKELTFKYLLWKIDTNKYLVAGKGLRLTFEDGSEKIIDGFLEIEYCDNEVVKIYNQELMYQTISEETILHVPEDIKINLVTKIVSKGDVNHMSLESMAIDSEDNIPIVDLEEDEEAEEEDTNTTNEQTTVNNENNQENNDSNTVNNNQTTQIQNQNQSTVNGSGGTSETVVKDNPEVIKTPKFKVSNFEISTTGVKAVIDITDDDGLLNKDTTIKIFKESSGSIVYEKVFTKGEFHIEFETQTLSPDTDYILQVESAYQVDEISYEKNFVYKQFKTNVIGISFEKDVFTNESMSFKILFEKNSKISKANLEIYTEDGEETLISPQEIINTDINAGAEVIKSFSGLESNTTYQVVLTDILYDGSLYANKYDQIQYHTTLKNVPTISGTNYEINQRDGNFILKIDNVNDEHESILSYRYEIYDTRIQDGAPIKILETNSAEAVLMIDNDVINRNIEYQFKVIATYYDNEKECETASELSEIISMEGKVFPVVSFVEDEETGVTFERIKGTLVITDEDHTIDIENDVLNVICTDKYGGVITTTTKGSLNIPIDINNLRSNETYKFEVRGTVDLQDGNEPIENCLIGTAIITTELPQPMIANFSLVDTEKEESDRFNTNFQLSLENIYNDLEPKTLTGITFDIYSGQTPQGSLPTGELVRTVTLKDSNTEPYESDLMTKFYNQPYRINPEFFGAEDSDFSEDYYTIVVYGAYDYTDYPNDLPIIENVYTLKTGGYIQETEKDPEKAFTSIKPIRNYTLETPDPKLGDSTIVGYSVTANYVNASAKKIRYKVINSLTYEVVDEIELDAGENGEIPSVTFDVKEGTEHYTIDSDGMRRGNFYFFTYEVDVDIDNNDEIGEGETYPLKIFDDEGKYELKSNIIAPQKQEPEIKLYPSISTSDMRVYKYNIYDIDKALLTNMMYAAIDNTDVDAEQIYPVEDIENVDFSTVAFHDLTKGDLKIEMQQSLYKKDDYIEDITLINEYFESENDISNLRFKASLDSNSVILQFQDKSGSTTSIAAMEKIVAFKVVLSSKDESDDTEYVYQFATVNNRNYMTIPFNEIAGLLNKETVINVTAYYDTGLAGFDMESEYMILQGSYRSDSTDSFYYILNTDGTLVPNTSLNGSMYIQHESDTYTEIKMESPINGTQNIIDVYASENGMKLEKDDTIILKKTINESSELTPATANGNLIEFNLILPGIDFTNGGGATNIVPGLNTVRMQAQIINSGNAEIINNKIYIELYECDDNYRLGENIANIEKNISDFENSFVLGPEVASGVEIQPRRKYAFKVYAMINIDGTPTKKILYDIFYKDPERIYYFETLSDVGLTIHSVNYVPVTYDEKYLQVYYTVEKTLGYDRIVYTIQKYQEGSWVNTGLDISRDTTISREMYKRIPVNPGSIIDFGAKYRIIISPLADLRDADGNYVETLDLGSKSFEFELEELEKPTIAVKGSRVTSEAGGENTSNIEYKITIYDDDRIVVGGTYLLEIYDDRQTEVTPANIKNQAYDISEINKIITFEGAEISKEYTLKIILRVDYENKATDIKELIKEYVVTAGNSYGVNVGTVEIKKNERTEGVLDVTFSDSDKIELISKMTYSIYNTSGYNVSGSLTFEPTEIITDDGEYIYSISIDNGENNISQSGTYIAVLQFTNADGELLEKKEIQFTYVAS